LLIGTIHRICFIHVVPETRTARFENIASEKVRGAGPHLSYHRPWLGYGQERRPSTLKIYLGVPHGLLTTNADLISQDLLAFVHG